MLLLGALERHLKVGQILQFVLNENLVYFSRPTLIQIKQQPSNHHRHHRKAPSWLKSNYIINNQSLNEMKEEKAWLLNDSTRSRTDFLP